MGRKLTYEEVKSYIESFEGYKLISEWYINARKKIRVKHLICKTEYEVTFSDFKSGYRCPKCGGSQKLTYVYVKNYIESFNDYKLISREYINNTTKLKIKHKVCNTNYETTFKNFRKNCRCSKCNRAVKHTYEYVKNYIEESGEYTLLSEEYKNAHQKIELLHKKCNTKFNSTWNYFQSGSRCPFCTKTQKARFLGITGKLLYDVYAHQIEFCEEVRRDPENYHVLQVRCKNSSCRMWFTPTLLEVSNRIKSINGVTGGENNLYCSEECKNTCFIYNQKLYPRGRKPYKDNSERNPYWRQLVLERDNFECQICGSTENLEAHHIDSIHTNPIMSADLENGITLCKKCHYKIHSELGCRYIDLTKSKIC